MIQELKKKYKKQDVVITPAKDFILEGKRMNIFGQNTAGVALNKLRFFEIISIDDFVGYKWKVSAFSPYTKNETYHTDFRYKKFCFYFKENIPSSIKKLHDSRLCDDEKLTTLPRMKIEKKNTWVVISKNEKMIIYHVFF